MSTQDVCTQRKLFLQFNIPPVRLEKQSPYDGTVTQQQLDMRRKVEILKYKNNSSNSGINQRQAFSQLARGNYNIGRISCDQDKFIPKPTTNSDVPGPVVDLVEEPNVPLYNYFNNTQVAATSTTENTTQWSLYPSTDVGSAENIDTTFATLVIRDAVKSASLIYNMQFPVSYQVSASNIDVDTSGTILNISSIVPKLDVVYNSSSARLVTGVSPNSSMSVQLDPSTNIITSNSASTYSFQATIFAGYLSYSDVTILTSPGFVYTLSNKITNTKILDLTTNSVSYTNTTQSGLLANISFGMILNTTTSGYSKTQTNCTILSPSESTLSKTLFINDNIGNNFSEIL